MGLFSGFSILSGVEIVYYLAKYVGKIFPHKKKTRFCKNTFLTWDKKVLVIMIKKKLYVHEIYKCQKSGKVVNTSAKSSIRKIPI